VLRFTVETTINYWHQAGREAGGLAELHPTEVRRQRGRSVNVNVDGKSREQARKALAQAKRAREEQRRKDKRKVLKETNNEIVDDLCHGRRGFLQGGVQRFCSQESKQPWGQPCDDLWAYSHPPARRFDVLNGGRTVVVGVGGYKLRL
jgi:hypothetical protein